MSVATEQQAVYVLNRRSYQETSLLVDIFSLNYGRFTVVAKGAMRKGSSWSATLQPFQPLLLSWSGRSSLKTLRSVDTPSAPYNFSSTYLFSGYYLNELIMKLLPENEVNEPVFLAYITCLSELAESGGLQQSLRKFEYSVLRELGYLPDFDQDISGNGITSDRSYQLLPQKGFEISNEVIGENRDLFRVRGGVLLMLGNLTSDTNQTWSKEDLSSAKHLMRFFVDEALGGQEIKSRELFKSIKY